MSIPSFLRHFMINQRHFREIVFSQICALIETSPDGVWVEMTGVNGSPNLEFEHAFARELMQVISQNLADIDNGRFNLGIREADCRRQREMLLTTLAPFSRQQRFSLLYWALKQGEDRLTRHVIRERGHVCRVTTNWQDALRGN